MTILCAAGIGLWVFTPARFKETSLALSPATQTTLPNGRAIVSNAPSVASAKPFESQAFDGIWEFSVTAGQYCPVKSFKFRRRFQGGFVLSEDGQKFGAVANDGTFRFSNPSLMNSSVTVQSQGKVIGDIGQGTYLGMGTPCQGTYQIRLVEKL